MASHIERKGLRAGAAIAALLLAGSSGAVAAEVSDTAAGGLPAAEWPARRFTLFGAAGGGYGGVFGDSYSQGPKGAHAMMGLSAATQIKRLELEAGLGWFYSRISGELSGAGAQPVLVRTRMGTVDLGARYRLTRGWQLGPVVNLAFGTDTSFGPEVGESGAKLLVGARAVYEFARPSFPVRLWSQLSTDAATDRHLIVALVGVQIGWEPRAPRRDGAEVATSGAGMSRDSVGSSWAAPRKADPIRVVLDEQRVFFGTNSKKLRPEISALLRDVGQYLKTAREDATRIEIDGHADQRGRYEYNLKLSRNRAESVRAELEQGGAHSDRMKVEAYSYSKLLDPHNTRAAWAKNRRVEITFHDVQDARGLRERLEKLQALSNPIHVPTTTQSAQSVQGGK